MEIRVRHGIKLHERKCQLCKRQTFWVPRSSHQKFCSAACESGVGEQKKKKLLWPFGRKRKVKVNYELKEDDYE